MNQAYSPPPAKPQDSGKSLMIALIVSAVFLLSAFGIALWLLLGKGGTASEVPQPTGEGSQEVKKVSFVAPNDLPVTYVSRTQNTHDTRATYYFDAQAGCGIVTGILPLGEPGSTSKDAVLAAAEQTKSYGITPTGHEDGQTYTIADADGHHTYDFASITMQQSVDVPGVPFKNQQSVVAYKLFGSSLVASIGYSCKSSAWEAKQPELAALVSKFKVKTER